MCYIEAVLETCKWSILAQDVFSLTYALLLDKPKTTLAVSSHTGMADGGKDGTWLASMSTTKPQNPSPLGHCSSSTIPNRMLSVETCRNHALTPGYE